MNNIIEERKKYVKSILDKIGEYKDSVNIKNIFKEVLNNLGYWEVSNNEVIISNLTILYARENDDFIDSVHQYLDCYSDSEIDNISDCLYKSIYSFIENNFIYTVKNDQAILESKTITFFDGYEERMEKNTSVDIEEYIRYHINEEYRDLNISDYSFVYDLKSGNTKNISHSLNSYITTISLNSNRPCVDSLSKYTMDEYDKEYKMVRDLSIEKNYGFIIKKGMDVDDTIRCMIANEENYTKLTNIKADGKKAKFIRKEIECGEDYYYETEIPLLYKKNIIDYFTGTQYQIDENDVTSEFDQFNLFFDFPYLNDEMIDMIHNRYNLLKRDLVSKTLEFDIEKMYPNNLDYVMGNIKYKELKK